MSQFRLTIRKQERPTLFPDTETIIGTTASPAGLMARARPEARLGRRSANGTVTATSPGSIGAPWWPRLPELSGPPARRTASSNADARARTDPNDLEHGLRTKILQVDQWVRQAQQRVVEVHPEASFACRAGAPLTVRKSTWAGVIRRRQLLTQAGIVLDDELGLAGEKAGVDD